MTITDEVFGFVFSIIYVAISMILIACTIAFTSKIIHEVLIGLGYISDLYIITVIITVVTIVGGIVTYDNLS